MELHVQKVDVWSATIPDQPGGLAQALESLAKAGANLQTVIARRTPGEAGKGVLFVTPVESEGVKAAAKKLGFEANHAHYTIRVIGPDRSGIGAEMTRKIAAAGVNLSGLTAAAMEGRFVAYAAVDSKEDAERVIRALETL